jgi:hypothetical protein
MSRKVVSLPMPGDLHHNHYWQAQETVSQAKAAWRKPHASLARSQTDVRFQPPQGQRPAPVEALLGARP